LGIEFALNTKAQKSWFSSVKSPAEQTAPLHLKRFESSADWELAHQFLDEELLLGAGKEAGDRLGKFILEDGQVVAILIWCASAWHLKKRDEFISWDPVTRAIRLKLIAQLRRFLVLDEHRRPNLASRCLGLGLGKLQQQWFRQHGYEPLVAESFSDPESHQGTVYKATNWTLAGDTKGFSQNRSKDDHTDYYLPNERPKKLWLKPFQKNACSLLCVNELPSKSQAGEVIGAGARSPLNHPQLASLREAFLQIDDPRRAQSRRHPMSSLLTLVTLGLLMGARDMRSIWKKVVGLTQSQRQQIGLKIRAKGSTHLRMPGYDCLNDFMNLLTPRPSPKFSPNGSRTTKEPSPTRSPSTVKASETAKPERSLPCAATRTGDPSPSSQPPAKKEDSEDSEARALLQNDSVQLVNKTVTPDPLHNKFETLDTIVRKGGDYIVGPKENTSKRLEEARRALRGAPLFSFPAEQGHGRIEQRHYAPATHTPVGIEDFPESKAPPSCAASGSTLQKLSAKRTKREIWKSKPTIAPSPAATRKKRPERSQCERARTGRSKTKTTTKKT